MNPDIAQNLKWGTGQLTRANIDTAALDAEVLLAHTLGAQRIDLHLKKGLPLADDESGQFENFIARRCRKEPVAYITGFKEFWSLRIAVTPDVLIPRPETEGIVERALKILKKSPLPPFKKGGTGGIFDILDLCTGSGCVAAALATELPDAMITVTDISPAAIEIAKTNLAFAGDHIKFSVGDLFLAISRSHDLTIPRKFNLITANPPYVADTDFMALEEDIKFYEPQLALTCGTDGLAISKRIIQDAPKYLKPGGTLIMEMGLGQADGLWNFASKIRQYDSVKLFEDYSGIERVLSAKRKAQSEKS